MYQAFDPFLAASTWHTSRDADRKRFYLALNAVVREADFDPEQMGDYMRAKIGVENGLRDHRDIAIGQRITDAWAVRDFFTATGAVKS
jgi:hypothetical protein